MDRKGASPDRGPHWYAAWHACGPPLSSVLCVHTETCASPLGWLLGSLLLLVPEVFQRSLPCTAQRGPGWFLLRVGLTPVVHRLQLSELVPGVWCAGLCPWSELLCKPSHLRLVPGEGPESGWSGSVHHRRGKQPGVSLFTGQGCRLQERRAASDWALP